MTRQAIIERTIKILHQLPQDKAEQVSDFADYILKQYEDRLLTEGIGYMTAGSKAFDFLNDEPDLYTEADVKAPYNGQR